MKLRQIRASLILTITSMIWGAAFLVQKIGMTDVGPFAFHGIRYVMAGTVVLPIALLRGKKLKNDPEFEPPTRRMKIVGGLVCGFALGFASLTQQLGILYEPSAGKAGFISALYMIIVPLLGLFLRRKVPFTVWIAAFIATFGLYLLCMDGSFSLGKGDFWLFACAFLYSVHILFIDYFAQYIDGPFLACFQFFVASTVGFGAMLITGETLTWEGFRGGLLPMLYTGVLSAGVGYTLQIVAQKDLHPAIASLVMSLESVFAALLGWLISVLTGKFVEENALSLREIVGCAVMFAAIVIAQSDALRELIRSRKEND